MRFAHDPRTQQVAMLEGDRFEVLDITTKPESEYVGLTLPGDADSRRRDRRDRARRQAVFPHGDDVLRAGDRVIVFTESRRVHEVENAL